MQLNLKTRQTHGNRWKVPSSAKSFDQFLIVFWKRKMMIRCSISLLVIGKVSVCVCLCVFYLSLYVCVCVREKRMEKGKIEIRPTKKKSKKGGKIFEEYFLEKKISNGEKKKMKWNLLFLAIGKKWCDGKIENFADAFLSHFRYVFLLVSLTTFFCVYCCFTARRWKQDQEGWENAGK